jgi:hypothetical protein
MRPFHSRFNYMHASLPPEWLLCGVGELERSPVDFDFDLDLGLRFEEGKRKR